MKKLFLLIALFSLYSCMNKQKIHRKPVSTKKPANYAAKLRHPVSRQKIGSADCPKFKINKI